MSRLDKGFWGPSATLPDEPPIEDESRHRETPAEWQARHEMRLRGLRRYEKNNGRWDPPEKEMK